MTLAIIDDLTPGDLTGGKRVAVTGTIAPDGTVGQIGEIQQKAISAKAAHAQIFIVPACGKDAACSNDLRRLKQRVGKHVDVEPVATLAQALRVLRRRGRPVRTVGELNRLGAGPSRRAFRPTSRRLCRSRTSFTTMTARSARRERFRTWG